MKTIVELIELEEKHQARMEALTSDAAKKQQAETKEQQKTLDAIETALRSKDDVIEKTVADETSKVATAVGGEAKQAVAINQQEIQKIILKHID